MNAQQIKQQYAQEIEQAAKMVELLTMSIFSELHSGVELDQTETLENFGRNLVSNGYSRQEAQMMIDAHKDMVLMFVERLSSNDELLGKFSGRMASALAA